MSDLLRSRRDQLARKGRPMVLRRQQGTEGAWTYLECAFTGKKNDFRPDQIQAGAQIQLGDAQVEMTADEVTAFAAATPAWGAPAPVNTDRVRLGPLATDAEVTIIGVMEIYDGSLLIGYRLWIRG